MDRRYLLLWILLLHASMAHALVSTNKLVFALDCEGNTLSSNGKHNAFNDIVDYATGKDGLGCDFEEVNGDYINMSNDEEFSFGNTSLQDIPFTWSFWVKPESAVDTVYYNKRNRAGSSVSEYEFQSGVVFNVDLKDPTTGGTIRISQDDLQPPIGQWTHIVVTYNGTFAANGLSLYMNGVLQVAGRGTQGVYNHTEARNTNLLLGASQLSGAPDRYYDGMMDEIYLWRGVQYNQTEVDQLWNNNNSLAYPFGALPPTFNETLQNITLENGTYSFVLNWSATNDALIQVNDTRYSVVTDNITRTGNATWNSPTTVGFVYSTWNISNNDGASFIYNVVTYFSVNVTPFFLDIVQNDTRANSSYTFLLNWSGTNNASVTSNDTRWYIVTYNDTKTANVTWTSTDVVNVSTLWNITNNDGTSLLESLHTFYAVVPTPPTSTSTTGNVSVSVGVDLTDTNNILKAALGVGFAVVGYASGVPVFGAAGGVAMTLIGFDIHHDDPDMTWILYAMMGIIASMYALAPVLMK